MRETNCDKPAQETLSYYSGWTLDRDIGIPSWAKLENHSDVVVHGGQYKPNATLSTDRIALLVPYRNRESQLQTFLKHIHPFLKNQSLSYRIFIIELVSIRGRNEQWMLA